MRLTNRSAYLVLLLICLYGCDKTSKNQLLVFKETRQATIEICSTPLSLNTYKDLWVVDSLYLVVGFDKQSEKYLHVFDRKSGQYINSFVDRGRSGNEIMSVSETWLSGDKLYIWDGVQKSLFACDLTGIDKQGILSLSECLINSPDDYKYPHVLFNGSHAIMLGNASFLENAPINNYPRLSVENYETGELSSLNTYPVEDRFKTWWMYTQPAFATREDFTKFVVLSNAYYGCILEIYDVTSGIIHCERTLTLVPPAFEGKANGVIPDQELCLGAIDAVCTDNYIIVAYDGETKVSDKETAPSFNKILWFDWEGNPVRRVNIDKSIVCLSTSNEDLYALVRKADGDVEIAKII